jgi:cell division protein FtsW (lipid II flippase)
MNRIIENITDFIFIALMANLGVSGSYRLMRVTCFHISHNEMSVYT